MIDRVDHYRHIDAGVTGEAAVAKDRKDASEAASEFESLFIYYMLETMRNSVTKSGLFGNDRGEEVYRGMLDEELSNSIAKAGGIGLKEILLRGLDGYNKAKAVDTSEDGSMAVKDGVPAVVDGWLAGKETNFRLPLKGNISSAYGIRKDPFTGEDRFHHGIDIPAPEGTPIYPSMEGTVIFSGEKPGYGNIVEIRHDNGYITRYAHNRENMVKEGQRVATSDMIATVGSTGRATGAHLHLEVRVEGFAVNPLEVMPFG
ncbi:MAG: peptidoglycan DD-metalloendopeptidase family protein [Deltaproteobacteria bacterium]|nr:peptidoglycan DD-metalloendopeptidase family protein [Deltaproteobacteria bacterium]